MDEAKRDGEVQIKRKDGTVFTIHPIQKEESPLDIEGIDLSLTAEEIVAAIREVRER
ncbi:MAG: type II toxin-antitoxin system Phd/YefM family antitoxin [candidate division KSB1 bacterium]|nr:type II toxin-antitoxin system Phd/YefM family antitoxin [candidate division KSB1 bacterium]MDQ7064929.1 type II toxin-antitoxin system Phd/YefM family antitoxin [candidate division KSB1 bacterium]